jgi:hypothetical protein
MRPKQFDIDPANASLTGFRSNATGVDFTLTATDSGDGLAHRVSVRNDSATDHSAKTLILVGTDPDGKAQTETIAAPDTSATVESSGYYLTLTSVTPSATIGADTFDIGWVDEVATQTIPIDARSSVSATVAIDVTGTINYTVQETFSDIQGGVAAHWLPISALASKTADLTSSASLGSRAIRLVVNSYTDTAEIKMFVAHPVAG